MTSSALMVLAVVLIVIGIVLFFVEVLVPSGGLIGIAAAGALITGIVMLFYRNTTLGLIGLICVLIAIPIVVGFGMKLWPYTPIGRMLILQDPAPPDAAAQTAGTLVGKRGQALNDLRPVGTCLIDGKRIECFANQGIIPAGRTIEVIDDTGMEIKVRAVDV